MIKGFDLRRIDFFHMHSFKLLIMNWELLIFPSGQPYTACHFGVPSIVQFYQYILSLKTGWAQVINLLESYGMIIPAPQGGEGFEPNYPCTSIYNTTVSGLYVHYLVDMANAGTQSNWIVGSMMAAMATYDYIVGLSNAQKAWCKCMKVTYGSSPC